MSEELPKGWIDVYFTDILDIQGGTQPPKKTFIYEPRDKYVRLLQIRDFGLKPLPTYIRDNQNLKKCKIDDLLIGRYGASVGRICTGMEGAYNVALAKVIIPNQIPTSFVRAYLNSFIFQQKILSITRSAQDGFNKDDLAEIPFPLPPLNEQKRIVAKLDTIMPRIEAVKERLDKVPGILKRFRQSVLTAAVTGKLTEQWRAEHPEVESAEVLLKHTQIIDKQDFSNSWKEFEIPDTWICTYLKNIADLRLGKMLDESKNKGETVKYIRNINVRWFEFDLDDLKEIRITKAEKTSLSVEIGDVFICEGGEPGRAAVWRTENRDLTFQKALHRARIKTGLLPDFLVYSLKVDADSQKLEELFTGSTIKHFTGRSLAIYPITLPPLEEQKEIVRQVDKLFALADKLEIHYQKAKARVDKLSQSVLAKAFRGELVPQDPNDEPAEKLLERILEEKAKMEVDLKDTKKRGNKK